MRRRIGKYEKNDRKYEEMDRRKYEEKDMKERGEGQVRTRRRGGKCGLFMKIQRNKQFNSCTQS